MRLTMQSTMILMAVVIFQLLPLPSVKGFQLDFDPATVFEEVWKTVEQDFFDPEFNGVDWSAIRQPFLAKAIESGSHDEFAAVINEMLATLGTSHTAYFPPLDPRYYQIIGIFEFLANDDQTGLLEYEGIGIESTRIDGKAFVRSVFDGGAAERAGIRFGDEIVSVDDRPFHPVTSFRGKSGSQVNLLVRSTASENHRPIPVDVETLNGRTMFEDALDASVKVHERNGKSIGYVHIWSYAGSKFHEKLKQHVLWGDLSRCDALIVDLRDGWGGASMEYLNLFRESVVEMKSIRRDGGATNFSGVWGKPVALLVNSRTTSGKELFTYGFRKLGLGQVIGENTAGAVVAGRPTMLSNNDILYLAVADLSVDGVRLEGKGVEPDHRVERPIPYAGGKDPQLERAIELLSEG